jgi:hypothetical protein
MSPKMSPSAIPDDLGYHSSNPNAKNSRGGTTGGTPVGLTLKVYRLDGKRMNSADPVATGKWDAAEEKWVFSGKDSALNEDLADVFTQEVVGRDARVSGSNKMPINSMQYVSYMQTMIFPRKKLTLKWEIKQ